MPPTLIDAIAPLLALVGMGTFTLIGMKMWFSHRLASKQQLGGKDSERLIESLEVLQDQLHGVRDEGAELQERVDFTEPLLAREWEKGRIEPPEADRRESSILFFRYLYT